MKNFKFSLILILTCTFYTSIYSQTTLEPDKACINCFTPDASAVLEIESTTKGILAPRMTSTQRTAIASPANGLFVYNITTKSFWYFNSTTGWKELASSGSGGAADNLGNHTATQNLNLNDNYLSNDGDNEGIRITDNGNVGIGVNTNEFSSKLLVQDNKAVIQM